MTETTIYLLMPELILVLIATAIYVGGAFTPARDGWGWLAAAGLLLAGFALSQQQYFDAVKSQVLADGATGLLSGPLVIDYFSQVMRAAIVLVGLVFVMLSSRSAADGLAPEFLGSLLLITAGLMLVAMGNDLVLMFLGLELVSIPTYVVLYLGRRGAESQESATKYFFLSILSSALMLYGFSFLYGVGGSTQLSTIQAALARPEAVEWAKLSKLALVLIVAGLGFRLTAVPFHFYAPDVYQGTSHPNAGLLAVVPKIAAVAALVRIVLVAMPGMERIGWQLCFALAVLTMSVGNMLALWQVNVRRLLAYSSIAHAGYMLIGLTVAFAVAGGATKPANMDGLGATLFYLLVYALATTGAFAALAYLSNSERQVDTLDDLAGLSSEHPFVAGCLAVCMFSLTGLPPLAGFWGKFNLLLGAWGVDAGIDGGVGLWFKGLALVGVINAAISAGYYLRVISTMYFRPALASREADGGAGAGWAMALVTLLTIGVGFGPGGLIDRANIAGHSVVLRAGNGPTPLQPIPSAVGQQPSAEPNRGSTPVEVVAVP